MPSRGKLRRPQAHPVYQSLEALLRRVNSASTAALSALRIARAHGAALPEEAQPSRLTAEQLLTHNLLEAVEAVVSCATLCRPTAKSACLLDPRAFQAGEHLSTQDTATQQEPSAKTERRRRQRASRKAKRLAAASAEEGKTQLEPTPTPPEIREPFPSWAQVTSDFSFGADTSMGLSAGTLSGEKRSLPIAETAKKASTSTRNQKNVKLARSSSPIPAVKHSLGAQQTADVGLSITQEPRGAVQERDKRAIDALVSASTAQRGLAICGTSEEEGSSMDDEEYYDG